MRERERENLGSVFPSAVNIFGETAAAEANKGGNQHTRASQCTSCCGLSSLGNRDSLSFLPRRMQNTWTHREIGQTVRVFIQPHLYSFILSEVSRCSRVSPPHAVPFRRNQVM